MTACLLLVDVENMRPPGGGRWRWRLPKVKVSRRCGCRIDSATVVLAVSAKYAVDPTFSDWANLCRMAEGAAALLDLHGADVSVEVALGLSVPESADRVLVKACQAAPTRDAQGPFQHVALLSGDSGLRGSVARAIRGNPWPPFHDRSKQPRAFMWCFLKRPWARSFVTPRNRERVAAIDDSDIAGPTVFVEDEHRCLWANEQRVQVSGNLNDIARKVSARPSLLTQVGVTCLSQRRPIARGVGRLRSLLAGHGSISLRHCDPHDGLALEVGGEPLDEHSKIRAVDPSPAGPGAARIRMENGQTATMGTTLPHFVVRELSGDELPITRGRRAQLDDERVLQRHGRGACEKGDSGRALFAKVKSDRPDFCEVRYTSASQPWWWWLEPDGRTTMTAKLFIPEFLSLPESIEGIPCVPTIVPSPSNHPAIGWRLSLDLTDCSAELAGPVAKGGVSRARLTARDGKRAEILVVAAKAYSGKVTSAEIMPIQDVGGWSKAKVGLRRVFGRIDMGQWFKARLLPLVVAGWPR
jgi:hypothetical protein